MKLVLRRARGAKSLLLAAAGATVIATVLITGLAGYSRDVVDAGARSAITAASPEERSVLVQGPAGSPEQLAERDRAVRDRATSGFAGFDTAVFAAGYATGRQLTGDVGTATPDENGAVFASVVFLDALPEHADLVAGAWPQAGTAPAPPGTAPVQTALAEAAARTLEVTVGDRIEITDRLSQKVSEVTVAGIWRPRDLTDPYWRLVPEAAEGVAPQSSTYGPLVVTREDFRAGFAATASAAWLIAPDLVGHDVAALRRAGRTAEGMTATLTEDAGFGSSGQVTSRLPDLVDRQQRADLVGRSALVTPMLLVVVLGGYALLLVAGLLTEQRRGETALLRARGAARVQLAGLAAREAALVVLPAAAVAPPLAAEALRLAERMPALSADALPLVPRLDALTWAVAVVAAIGCGLAMLGPSLRRGGTYASDLASRSRPTRQAAAQRIGLDLALVGLAVLGWLQLRQYSSPVGGAGGIDPLLASAPTLGVLAGAVLALRILPPMTRFAERYVARRNWTATMFGMWQAGRRPHAGPVLLLTLAVAVSTLAWCLTSTSERSLAEQADHTAGADLRLVELGAGSEGRADEIANLPGVTAAVPAWRDRVRAEGDAEISVASIDAGAVAGVARMRADLAAGDPAALFARMADARPDRPSIELPAGDRFTGEVITELNEWYFSPFVVSEPPVSTAVVFETNGAYRRVLLGTSVNGQPLRFTVDLPKDARLAGFVVDTGGGGDAVLNWRLASLAVDGTPVDLPAAGPWQAREAGGTVDVDPRMSFQYKLDPTGGWGIRAQVSLVLSPNREAAPVPVVGTPAALAALRLQPGARTRMSLGPAEVDVTIVGTADAIPGTANPAALLVDLPSLAAEMFYQYGNIRPPQEWWLATRPGEHAAASAAAARLSGIEVLDRQALADAASSDPYGIGARAALFAAALGAILLAGTGVGVDMRATARRRTTELAVLQTLGAGHRLLARSLIAEQAFLAGIGVLVGAAVGIAVAATMAPLVILTPSAARPVPEPLLDIAWWPVIGTAVGLLALTLTLGGLVATTVRQRLAAAQLRIGSEA